MIINELKDTCPRCGGMGFQAGISRMGIAEINVGGICGQCEGRGFLLTEKGRDLLDLMRPFIEGMFEEWLQAREATPSGARPAKPPDEDQSDS